MCRFSSEKRNYQKRRSSSMIEFFDTIEDLELIDFPLEGRQYTWFKGDTHTTTSIIDQILLMSEWCDQFNNMK